MVNLAFSQRADIYENTCALLGYPKLCVNQKRKKISVQQYKTKKVNVKTVVTYSIRAL